MPRSYEGDVFVTVGANTEPADKKIDALFDRIEDLQHIEIDANISTIQRKLSTLAKRTNEQMSSGIVKGMLKDFKTVLGAMKSEYEKNGIDTVIYKNLEKTANEIENRFANLSVSIGKKQITGLEKILNGVSELESISDIKFDAIISQNDVRNSEAVVKNVKETKKAIESIIGKIAYVGTTLSKDVDDALSEQKIKGLEQRVLGLKEQLKSFSEIDNPLIEATLEKAERKATEVLEQISAKQTAVTNKQIEATNDLADANNNVGNAAENAAKKADKAVRKTLSTLDKATKKYNEIMENLERGHRTIGTPFSQGTDNWGLAEMLDEVKQIYDTYNEIGHKNNQLKTENFQMWKSHTASLRGFLSSYAKHYEGSAEAIYNEVQKKKEELEQYRGQAWDNSISADGDKYLAFIQKELELETQRLRVIRELVQLGKEYRNAPLFAWTERPSLDKDGDAIAVAGLAESIKSYEDALDYSTRKVQREVDAAETRRRIANPKYTPIRSNGEKVEAGVRKTPADAYKYIRNQHWSLDTGVRLDLESMAKESPDEASRKYLDTRREIADILNKEKLEYQDIIKLLEVYNQKCYQTLTQSKYIADAINMAADIETKIGRGTDFAYDNYLTTALNSLNEPGKIMHEYVEMYANVIAKRLGVSDPVSTLPVANTAEDIANMLNKLHEITGRNLREYLDMVQRGVEMSKDAKDILTALKLIDELGNFVGKRVIDGMNNHGVIMNDTHAIIQRDPDFYEMYDDRDDWNFGLKENETYLDKLISKMKIAEQRGVSLAKVLAFVQASGSYSNMGYDVQELAPGESMHVVSNENKNKTLDNFEKECERIVNAKAEHIQKLMKDAVILNDLGFDIDFGAGNVLYDAEKGFTFIDLALRELNVSARTTTQLMESLFRCLSGFGVYQDIIADFAGESNITEYARYVTAMESVLKRLNAIFADYSHANLNDVNNDPYTLLSGFHNKAGTKIDIGFTPTVSVSESAMEAISDDLLLELDDDILLDEPLEIPVTPKLVIGDDGQTFAGSLPINFKYAVISADDLIVSHDAYGNVNQNYPSELQPRDRTRISSTAQILGMVKKIIPELLTSSPTAQNGSPIVNSNGVVIGGNARSIALTEAYRTGYAEAYSKYIAEHASEFGLNAIGLPKNPILVRVVDDDSDFGQLAKQLNAATTAGYSTTEQAMINEELVMKVISKLNLDESANLNSAANRDFINSFVNLLSDNQRNEMVTSDGSLSAIGLVKVKQAVMSAAYGSKEMLENLEQINPELANISNALMTVAAKAADVRYAIETGGLNDLGVISTVLNGVELLKASKHAGYANIEEYLGQQTMFGATYSAEDIAIGRFIEENVRSATQIGNMLNILFDSARNAGDPMQVSFDGLKDTSLESIVKNAFAQYAQKYNKKINYNDLVSGYLPAESGSRSDKRVDRAAVGETRELGQQIGIAAEKEEELLEAAESVADATKEQKEETKELNKEKNKGNKKKKEEPVDKVADLLEKNTLKTLEQISAAERKTRTGYNFDVSTTEELEDRFSNFAQALSDDTEMKIGKIKVGTKLATLELYNDEAKKAVRYTYKVVEAAEDGTRRLEVVNEEYAQNIKALQENKFDVAGYKAIATRAVEELRASLKGLKAPEDVDLDQLGQQADDITSKDKLTAFNNQVKAAKKSIDTLKQSVSTSNSMNTLVSTIRGMGNAENTIRDYQVDLNQLGNIPGVDKAQEKIDTMAEAVRKYKEEAKTGNDQIKFFNEFNDAQVALDSMLPGLKDLSKWTADMDKAEVTLRRMQLTLEGFKDLDGFGDAMDAYDRMSESFKNFNDTDDVAQKALAHAQYTSAESELKARLTALRELNKEYSSSEDVFKVQDKLYNQRKQLIQLQFDDAAQESDLQAAQRKTDELEKQYEASLLSLKSEEDYIEVLQREDQLLKELGDIEQEQYIAKQNRIVDAERKAEEAEKAREIKLYEDEQDALAKARMDLQKERDREQKEQKDAQDAIEKTKRAQDKLYESKKKLVKLQLDESASDSDLQATQRKTEELEQQYDIALSTLRTLEDYERIKQRESQLEDELTDVQNEQNLARAKRLEAADKKAEELEIEREKALYEQEQNALAKARREILKEQAEEQKKQKENQEELIRLQKKYNEADYKWNKADIDGSDKTPYNKEMESYVARMTELRKETKLTADQEVELNRINNEHLQRKQKLLNAVASADSKALDELRGFSRWESDIKNVGMISDETAERINNMRVAIDGISDSTDIQKLAEDFKTLKSDVKYETTQSKDTKSTISEIKSSLQAEKAELKSLFGQLDLNLDLGDAAMTAKQIEHIYEETTDAINRCSKAAGEYNQDEIAAIFGKVEAAKNAMRERQEAEYKWWYGDGGGNPPGGGGGNNPPFDENQIKQWYQSLNATIQQISKIETKMHSLMKKDDGTGAWAPLIESLESQKYALLDRVRTIGQEINAAFGGQFVYGDQVDLPFSSILSSIKDFDAPSTISDFFNDIRTQTVLSEQSIEKFISTLQGAQNKTEEFSTVMRESIYSTLQSSEKTLSGLFKDDMVDPQNDKYVQAVQLLDQYKKAILSVTDASTGKLTDPSSWTSQQVLGLMAITDALNKYTSAVKTGAEAEAKYFEAKKQYANVSSLQDYDDETANMENIARSTNSAREKLEQFVKDFKGGQKIITGFTTSANGISRIDFSVLEEGTGNLRHLSAEMGQFTSNIYTVENSLKNMTAGTQATKSSMESIEQLMGRLGARGMTVDNNDYVAKLRVQLDALKQAYMELSTSTDVGDQAKLQNMAMDAERLVSLIKSLEKAWLDVKDAVNDEGSGTHMLGKFDKNADSAEQFAQSLQVLAGKMDGTVVEVGDFSGEINKIPVVIETADGKLKKFIIDVEKLGGTITASLKSTEKAKTGLQELGASFGGLGKDILQYGKTLVGVYDFVRYLRQGFNEVLEIDTAMTELKKVTEETDIAYSNFLKNAYTSAKKIGSTMKDFTQATADFARLGYNMNEASMLAEAANVYMNVGDGIDDVGTASESIISTMKAFSVEAEDAMGIVDRFNEVGKVLPVDNYIGQRLEIVKT